MDDESRYAGRSDGSGSDALAAGARRPGPPEKLASGPRSLNLLALATRYTAFSGLFLLALVWLGFGWLPARSVLLGVSLGLLNAFYLRWATRGQAQAVPRPVLPGSAPSRSALSLPAGLKLAMTLLLLWVCLRWLHAQPLWLAVGLGAWLVGLLLAVWRSFAAGRRLATEAA